MNHLRIALFLFFSLFIFLSYGAEITGSVLDPENNLLPGATVRLISLPDSLTSATEITNERGVFVFKKVKVGQYILKTSAVGLEDNIKKLNIKDNQERLSIGEINLKDNPVLLKEAVVTAIRPAIIAKQDTIEYNADSFHTTPNANVEQLLKKLPGIEVASDGSITSNGKSVSKILVDGKEFFADDPQMASKNLPSNMIDKVQVVDRKSDFSRLTGIDDGEEETVINLKVKKDMNDGWFGNLSGGYGINDKYNGSFIINNFHNGNQITLLGGMNNINENGFTDRAQGRFRNFGGTGGITTAQRLGLNFNIGNEEIFRIGGNILYTHSNKKVSQRSHTQFLYPDSVNYQNAQTLSDDKGHNLNVDLRLQWNINENNTLDFRPRFFLNLRDSEKMDSSFLRAGDELLSPINQNLNRQFNRGNNLETSGNLIFTHKFKNKPGRTFSIDLQYNFTNTKQKYLSSNSIIYYLLLDQDEDYNRFLDNRTSSNSIEGRISWLEPLGDPTKGNFLSIAYRTKYQWNNSDLLTYQLPDEIPSEINFDLPPDAIFDPDLSNRFRNKFFTQELRAGYKKVSKTLNMEVGLMLSPSSSKSIDLINDARNIPIRWVWNISPYATARVKFNNSLSLRANYRARTSAPSLSQLQPVADVSDPLNIKVGNPDLKPTFTQNIGVNLNNFISEKQQSLMLMMNVSFALNSIGSRTVTNPETGGRTTSYSNVNGNTNLMFMGMFSGPFSNKKWRFNARLNSRYSSTPGYINGDFNRSDNISISPSGGITFSSDIFQGSLNPNFSYSTIHNSLPQQKNRNTYSYGFNADFSLFLPFGLELTTDLNFASNSGYSSGYNINQWLWNAQLSYSFLSDKQLTFAVKAYDILHQKENIIRSISSSAIIDTEYNDITRYVMFSLTWNFNTIKKKTKNQDPDERFFNEGPPPLPPTEGPRRGNSEFRPGPPPGGRPPF